MALDVTPSLIDSFQKMSIRKGDTFHSPSKNELWDPLEPAQSRSIPRSTTCPKALEDLLIGAGERRVADMLARVDKAIETQSKLALGAALSDPDVLPLPSFQVDDASKPHGAAEKTRSRLHRNSHSSDSGIGSSVADSVESVDAKASPERAQSLPIASTTGEERGLSKYAAGQIHQHIIQPILHEPALKDFHQLIKDVPSRIGNKEIKTLRDLERSLIFLAPDYSRSPSKYLQFCERTIRVLHTTVTTLHESDQRAPADRPYTQGYFCDLVEQIRRYATILAATREKQAKGEKLDEMDYTPGESVSLLGGMSHNGKAPELVRRRADGKTISIATGREVSPEDLAASTMKRQMPDLDADEDEALRSMARRKKGAKPEIHECPLCDKEFKRPCDLTKHVKTHERPWKCTDETCKYYEVGWPTEKERDRHVNDKHSIEPALYHCMFKPCPYTSKRESNCKQHMEKAHGWEYVRSKSNGKGKLNGVTRLPRGSVPQSPASVMLTPLTPIAPSPSTQSWSTSSRRESMAPPGVPGPSTFGTPAFTHPSPEFAGHFNMNFNFNDMTMPMTPAMSDDRRDSSTSSHLGLQLDGSSYNSVSPHDLDFDHFDISTFNIQQHSPNSHAGLSGSFSNALPHNLSIDSGFAATSHAPHTSPGAQLNQTFTSSNHFDVMHMDEGYSGEFGAIGPSEDFTLFGNTVPSATTSGEMFPSLPIEGGTWENYGGQFDVNAPLLSVGNSTLDELFPELRNQ